MKTSIRRAAVAAAVLLLAGCATVGIDDAVRQANTDAAAFTGGRLELARSADQRRARAELSEQLLSQPLSPDGAVQLALANSPAVQALVADSWNELASADQAGRIGNPVFSFERVRSGDELELGVGSSRVDLQACKLEYSIVSPK